MTDKSEHVIILFYFVGLTSSDYFIIGSCLEVISGTHEPWSFLSNKWCIFPPVNINKKKKKSFQHPFSFKKSYSYSQLLPSPGKADTYFRRLLKTFETYFNTFY